MTNRNDDRNDLHHANPDDAARDARAAARQDQVHSDHDRLRDFSQRVDASVSDGAATDRDAAAQQEQVRRDREALQQSSRAVESSAPRGDAATDPTNAALQDRVRADHDALQQSSQRVQGSAQTSDAGDASRKADHARENADAARRNNR